MGSKKSMNSKEKGTHIFFGPNIVPKKVWVPKKKGTHIFFGPNIVPKKNGFQKKYEFQKKKGIHTFGYLFAGTFFSV